ncbi:hypothetical protein UB33_00580 [Photobacterium angustum]|uniref:Ig-like domain-containing protein n=1 Tax=Photobacterium angustum TaxID=661 RepID=UPI0005E39EA9|nr:Ig-like domain-containing protein [Photobacterium angustum]KJF93814.1 hypothetical protein UB39_13875 [Photobacterium angustum]KJG08100.1 hypothetical protein UB33_00580 [Photobacterium angustum]PSV89746.1 hypothetical protein CTN01_17325 [Photobacterium angustum]PSW82232.1 hypothetical protein CTN03_03420 [Photobacterium angustum]
MNKGLVFTALFFMICLVGCGDSGDNSTPDKKTTPDIPPIVEHQLDEIYITAKKTTFAQQQLSLNKGLSLSFQAEGHYSDGHLADITQNVIWQSSEADVAYFGLDNTITAVREGETLVTARWQGIQSEPLPLMITYASIQQLSIELAMETMQLGSTQQAHVIATLSDQQHESIDKDIDWQTSTPELIDISEQGVISALDSGVAEISALFAGFEVTQKIIILAPKITQLQLVAFDSTMSKGTSQQVKVNSIYDNQSILDITNDINWQVADPNIISIQKNNQWVAKQSGTTEIVGEFAGFQTDPLTIKVKEAAITQLHLSSPQQTLTIGQSIPLTLKAQFSDGNIHSLTQGITWSSLGHVIISENGKLTAQSSGETSIWATVNGVKSNPVVIKVAAAKLSHIEIMAKTNQMLVGETTSLKAMAYYDDGQSQDISGETDFVILDNHSRMKHHIILEAIQPGKTRIKATYKGKTSEIIDIDIAAVQATSLDIEAQQAYANIPKGTNTRFKVVAAFNDGTNRYLTHKVTWHLSHPEILTMTGQGSFQANAVGHTDIWASYGEINTKPLTVKVTDAAVDSFYIDKAPITIAAGHHKAIKAFAKFSDDNLVDVSQQVTWTSRQPEIGDFDTGNHLLAKQAGQVTIDARFRSQHVASKTLNISQATINKVQLAVTQAQYYVGDHFVPQLQVKDSLGNDVHIENSQVKWYFDHKIVQMFEPGHLQAMKAGQFELFAVVAGQQSNRLIIAIEDNELQTLIIQSPSTFIIKGAKMQLQAIGEYSNGQKIDLTSKVTWSSNDQSRISVSDTGMIKGHHDSAPTRINATFNTQQSHINIWSKKLAQCPQGQLQENQAASCIHTSHDDDGNLFSASPSLSLIKALGYTKEQPVNVMTPWTYADVMTEHGIDFPVFHVIDENHSRPRAKYWCVLLNHFAIAGKNTWHVPDDLQLINFANTQQQFSQYWPLTYEYFAKTPLTKHLIHLRQLTNNNNPQAQDLGLMTCIAD